MTVRWIVPGLVAILVAAVAALHDGLARGKNTLDEA